MFIHISCSVTVQENNGGFKKCRYTQWCPTKSATVPEQAEAQKWLIFMQQQEVSTSFLLSIMTCITAVTNVL
jgi:hypothetical protein